MILVYFSQLSVARRGLHCHFSAHQNGNENKSILREKSNNILMCNNFKPTARDVVTQETLNL